MTKNRDEVHHSIEQLESYLDDALIKEGITFDQWIAGFGRGLYDTRNRWILELLKPSTPKRIFEFACSGGFLAKLLLDNIPGIQQYTCTNFSARVVQHSQDMLRQYENCSVELCDANVFRSDAMDRENLQKYDTIITTSFEHIEYDIELIEKFRSNVTFVFSVAGFDDPEHFRLFSRTEDIRQRYGGALDIQRIVRIQEGLKFVVLSRKK